MSDEKLPQEENEEKIPTTETVSEIENKIEKDKEVLETEEKTTESSSSSESAVEEVSTEETSENNSVEETIVEEKKLVDESSKEDASQVKASVDEEGEDEDEVAYSEDEEDEEEHEEKAQKDYSSLSEKELVAELDKLLKTKKIQELKHDVEEIRSEFNSKFNEELEHKKEEFLAEGGNIIDFHYTTPLKKEFNSLYFDYKEKRNSYYKNLKKDLQANIDKRWELIEELKGLLSAEENINTTYNHFKEIQEKWHMAGAIPRDKYNTVWN